MKFRNIILAFWDQLPLTRFFKNFFITGNARGLFSIRSHVRGDGKVKQIIATKDAAIKVADKMAKRHGVYFSNYKCMHCDGYHVGKNQPLEVKNEK